MTVLSYFQSLTLLYDLDTPLSNRATHVDSS